MIEDGERRVEIVELVSVSHHECGDGVGKSGYVARR